MDISQITDINQLKAMAYDQISAKEQADHNLRMLNARIAEVQQAAANSDKGVTEVLDGAGS